MAGLSGCAESAHQLEYERLQGMGPQSLRHLVDSQATYAEVKAAPANFTGKTVMFGGTVIRAVRKQNKTEVEVLQLPTDAEGVPVEDRSQSQGRFIMEQESFLDPATLEAGAPITVIGRVLGETTRPLSEGQDPYTYPVLQIAQILNWQTLPQSNQVGGWAYQYNPYAFYGPGYWGPAFYGGPFWYPWGYGGYYGGRYGGGRYYGGSGSGSGGSSYSGTPPPQFRGGGGGGFSGGSSGGGGGSVPPQFRKGE
ncbi:MAG: Slp family lipoprotein [Nitrospiraceae bacterium]